ncbi:fibronectin-like [Branchiostoma floridae]|uniref:Fibronectin-like n=1 Tax=Branchiostoma floridae TaxID=7739 RepID=A0A9J7KUE6_BRAFL|nr:fibronectin-like [Branchiostoma floridae]
MESGAIPDSSITASSFADGKPPKDARLNGNSAWVPENDRAGEWLQVDLGEMMRIDGAITQGHSGSWVTEYVLQYSADGTSFTTHVGSDGSDKIFTANADDSTPVANLLNNPVEARYMRFVVQSWSDSGIALKLEIWGCNTVPRLSGLTLEDVGLNLDNDDQTDDDQLTVSWEVVGNLPISRYSLSYSLGYSLSYSLSYSYPLDQEVGSPPTADATSATVPGLQADTDYIIRLTSFDDTDQPTGVVSGTFKTAPRLSGLTLDRAGINSLTVSWKVFGNLPTSSFILSYQLADGSDSSADLPTPPAAEDISATVSGLLVGREYTITLTSKDESSQTNAEISGTYKTAECDAGYDLSSDGTDCFVSVISALTLKMAGVDDLEVSWTKAAGAQIDSYSLSYEPADGTGTSEELNSAPEPGDISATVSGLLPYTRYILTLNSTDPDRQNGHTIGTFRTESVISGLTLIRAGIDDLEVSWTKDASAQIDSYSLSYEPADGTGTSVDLNSAPGADDISATVPGLLPYTSYVITLTSSDQGRENGVIVGTFRTESVISDLTLDGGGMDQLVVSWGKAQGSQISRYSLSYRPVDGTGSYRDRELDPPAADATSATVSGLLPGISYTITLTSFQPLGNAGRRKRSEQDRQNGVITRTFRTESAVVNVECAEGNMTISIPRVALSGVDVGSMHLLDTSCVASVDVDWVTLETHLEECGTRRQISGEDKFIFSNEAIADEVTDSSGAVIYQGVSLPFQCEFLRQFDITQGGDIMFVIPPPRFEIIDAEGEMTLEMRTYKSPDFGASYKSTDFPIKVTPDDRLNFGLSVTSPLDNVELFARDCVSTPSTDPNDSPRVDIIVDGCQVAETLEKDNERSNDTALYYTVAAFGFPNSIEQNLVKNENVLDRFASVVAGEECLLRSHS